MSEQTLSITVDGLEQFQRVLKGGSAEAKQEVAKATYQSALALQGTVKRYAPIKTGTLRRSITMEAKELTATVGTNLHYAPHLEFGTRDHGPVSAPALVFQVGGKWIRTKRVRGIKATGFFRRAVEDTTKTIQGYYEDALDRIIRYLAS